MNIAQQATLELVSPELKQRLASSLGAVSCLPCVSTAELSVQVQFQEAVRAAIASIERRSGGLLERFIGLGPYEGDGDVPTELATARVTDAEAERAITLLYSHAVNAFKGQLAEILALGPCSEVLQTAISAGRVSREATLFIGDAAKPASDGRTSKGADLHVLSGAGDVPVLEALAEVKSFARAAHRLTPQLVAHDRRARGGLRIQPHNAPIYACQPRPAEAGPLLISVAAGSWRLSRGYRFESVGDRSFLRSDAFPPVPADAVEMVKEGRWHVTLGWSQEALAAEAYGLTYWYMERLGEAVFRQESPWPEMTPAEAGSNAATQSLYCAIRRSRDRSAEQRAIALYNAYGFGYALGTSYKDGSGRRHMLWPEDLREMLATKRTGPGPRIRD